MVHLPPLRHRLSDVPELAFHFAIAMCGELGWELFRGFTDAAARQLLTHPWPGNVRELKNAVERSVSRWGDANTQVGEIVLDPFESPYSDWDEPGSTAGQATPTPTSTPPSTPARPRKFTAAVADYEKNLLQQALADNHQHQGNTAGALGLSYDQLRGLLRKHKLVGARRKRRKATAA